MKRIELEKEFRARSINEAARKASNFYRGSSLDWVADELQESVENGYYYCCNASISNTVQYSLPRSPSTSDWTYYWGLEEVDEGNFYTWLIIKEDS